MILALSIFLILSVTLNIILCIGILRALRHKEEYDGYFDELQNRLTKMIESMREIDLRGAFESDDEVGGIFKQMQAMIESLDVFLLSEGKSNAEEK